MPAVPTLMLPQVSDPPAEMLPVEAALMFSGFEPRLARELAPVMVNVPPAGAFSAELKVAAPPFWIVNRSPLARLIAPPVCLKLPLISTVAVLRLSVPPDMSTVPVVLSRNVPVPDVKIPPAPIESVAAPWLGEPMVIVEAPVCVIVDVPVALLTLKPPMLPVRFSLATTTDAVVSELPESTLSEPIAPLLDPPMSVKPSVPAELF